MNCDSVFLKTPYDQEPEYETGSYLSSCIGYVRERDDFKDFMRDHHGHRLEDLTIIEGSFISDRAYMEPVKVSYFKVTNGKENFIVRRFRERIGEPLRYELIAGDYSLTCVALDIQARGIEKELIREFRDYLLDKKKIEAFIRIYDQIVKNIDTTHLERISEESPHPLEIFYKMDNGILVDLLKNCRAIFIGQEFFAIKEFIHRHKDDGVLLLKATYRIRITERDPAVQKRIIPALQPIERERLKHFG